MRVFLYCPMVKFFSGLLVEEKGWAQAPWDPVGTVTESRRLVVSEKSYTSKQVAGKLLAAPVTQPDKKKKKSKTLCSSFYHWGQMEISSLRKFNFPIKMLMKP